MPRERNNDYLRVSLNISNKCINGKWKLFIIAAEGDKTESLYFKEFKNYYKSGHNKTNIHIEFIDKIIDGKSSPEHVKSTIDDFIIELKKKYKLTENYDELWLIIDTDDYKNRKNKIIEIYLECKNSSLFYCAINNPCFELWLILHLTSSGEIVKNFNVNNTDGNKTIEEYIISFPIKKRPKICKKLFHEIHQNKLKLYTDFFQYIPDAIKNAKALGISSPGMKDFSDKISTNLYELVEKLI